MSCTMSSLRLSIALLLGAGLAPSLALAQGWADSQQALTWQYARSPYMPSPDAIAGGPGNSPDPNSPMFICRAPVRGSVTPGKWIKGNCNVAYDGNEVVARDYQVAYGRASWRSFGSRNDSGLIQTGREADGTPLYSCRVRYRDRGRDVGYQPGKIVASGKCDIAYDGREISMRWPFEALYAGNVGTSASIGAAYPGQRPGYYPPGPGYDMPLCRASDRDVHLKKGIWTGPGCIPVDARTNQPVYGGQPPEHTTYRVEQLTAPPPPPNQPRPLCRKGDPGVSFTAVGYAGPNCITTNVYGEVAAYGNATAEERARYAQSTEPCKPGDASVHVENGMLVGADCKSVPEPVVNQNDDSQQKAQAAEKAAANHQAAREAEAAKAREAEARAEQDKAAQAKAEQEQKAAEEKAVADQRAARDAEELRKAKEAQAKADGERAAQEQAAQAKAAQEQKAAEEKAAADERAAGEAEELRMAKEAEAKADAEKAAQDKAAQEKAEQEQKAAAEPPPPPTEETHAEPSSGLSSGP